MSDVTRILDRVQQGDSNAAEELLPLVYDELRNLADDHDGQRLLQVNEALDRLALQDPTKAEIVKLRFSESALRLPGAHELLPFRASRLKEVFAVDLPSGFRRHHVR